MRKIGLCLLIMVLASSAVFAAGRNDGGRTGGAATIRMSWWGGDNRHQAYLAAINVYEAKNPNVKFEAEYQAWDGYQTKLWTQLASGAQADIAQLDAPWFPELSQMGDIFVDYYSQKILDLSGFDRDFMSFFGEWNGKLIGIPAGVNANTLLLNKSAADELNLDLSEFWKEPFTFERFLEVGEALNKANPSKYLYTGNIGSYNALIRTRLKQLSGKQLYNPDFTLGFTEQQLTLCFQFCVDMLDRGAGSPIQEAELFKGQIEQSPIWVNSNALMAPDWASAVSRYQGTLPQGKVVVTCRHPTDRNAVEKGSQIIRPNFMFSVKKASRYSDAALEFLQWFFNSEEAAAPLSDTRGINVTEIQRKKAIEAGVANPESSKMVEIGMKFKLPDESPLTTNTELERVMMTQVSKVMYKQMTPAACAAETARLLTQKLAELKAAGFVSQPK